MTDAQTDRMLEAHKFSPEGSIWAPESLQQVRDRLEFIGAHECDCGETPHESALHDLAHDDVPVLLKVIERQATEVERLRARLGPCPCDRNPETSDGPSESCPHHGRTYDEWVERGDALADRIEQMQGALDKIQHVASVRAIGAHAAMATGSERGFLDILAIIERSAASDD